MSVGKPFLRSLEGIRAYAFLMVFFVHFSGLKWKMAAHSRASIPLLIGLELSFVAVPIFFALSGYLITGILFDTHPRPRYFRVFYIRRAIRVLPLYYSFLLASMLGAVLLGYHLRPVHLLYFVYTHNWSADVSLSTWGNYLRMTHLWSMAVEEQFSVLWPVVVWLLRTRR